MIGVTGQRSVGMCTGTNVCVLFTGFVARICPERGQAEVGQFECANVSLLISCWTAVADLRWQLVFQTCHP